MLDSWLTPNPVWCAASVIISDHFDGIQSTGFKNHPSKSREAADILWITGSFCRFHSLGFQHHHLLHHCFFRWIGADENSQQLRYYHHHPQIFMFLWLSCLFHHVSSNLHRLHTEVHPSSPPRALHRPPAVPALRGRCGDEVGDALPGRHQEPFPEAGSAWICSGKLVDFSGFSPENSWNPGKKYGKRIENWGFMGTSPKQILIIWVLEMKSDITLGWGLIWTFNNFWESWKLVENPGKIIGNGGKTEEKYGRWLVGF